MQQSDRFAMGKDRDAAILLDLGAADMAAGKVDLALAEAVDMATPQPPAILGMHRWLHRAAVPGFGSFEHVARACGRAEAHAWCVSERRLSRQSQHHSPKLAEEWARLMAAA